MKLIKLFRRFKHVFSTKFSNHETYLSFVLSICVLACIAIAIWIGGPYVVIDGYVPLAQTDKRVYVILSLYLLWLLKLLLVDLGNSTSLQTNDPVTQQKLLDLQNRFYGALRFLKKTTVSKHGKQVPLNQLPRYLLIGAKAAGKTALLVNSGVNFILHRRFTKTNDSKNTREMSENCDWWVTRDVNIIDVPGNYLSKKNKDSFYNILWQSFLRLLKKQYGKNGINGILIALPLAEIMQQNDLKQYQLLLNDLVQRLRELQEIFTQPIRCQLIITKCDLLTGFNEFFIDSGKEETTQAWGISLHEANSTNIFELFTHHFDALIKKLNEQLIWRLHQERNPMLRPYVKDFPLQIEKLKELTLDFIKKFLTANLRCEIQAIYLTSALQTSVESNIIDDTTQRAIQVFKEPVTANRPYFIKQLITHGIAIQPVGISDLNSKTWTRRIAYGMAASVIALCTTVLIRDFEHGVKQAYVIQNNLADYQLAIQHVNNHDEHFLQTLSLLSSLSEATENKSITKNILDFTAFYSKKSQQKTIEVYRQALQTILLPELRDYFANYLINPANQNPESVYAVFKAYLMMGDKTHFQADYVINTLKQILPTSMDQETKEKLFQHINIALTTNWVPLKLDPGTIDETRQYFTTMRDLPRAYIILKNTHNNYENEMLTWDKKTHSSFIDPQNAKQIPILFTKKIFPNALAQETVKAAQEAISGNWILGIHSTDKNPPLTADFIEQLRSIYISKYIEVWEEFLNNIHLSHPTTLTEAQAMLTDLTSAHSPLLRLLQTLHDNTYFEPIISSSPKLQSLGSLVEKANPSEAQLYQIFIGLQHLQQYLQTILTSANESKAAFDAINHRLKNATDIDAITQLRLIAAKSPEPIRTWLEKITNDTWNLLTQDAGRYLDTSWNEQVIRVYQTEIANRYPFGTNSEKEVAIKNFINFFGNPGIVLNFYNQQLESFIDTSSLDWRWKTIDNISLPFSEKTLRQLQYAIRIHQTFFPKNNNTLAFQFSLQPYKFGDQIKSVTLRINDKQFIDQTMIEKNSHKIFWPGKADSKTTIQLMLNNQQIINRIFFGDWAWLRIINESIDSVITKREMLINLSMNGQQPAKYLLKADGPFNPFVSLDLQHFQLSPQLTKA